MSKNVYLSNKRLAVIKEALKTLKSLKGTVDPYWLQEEIDIERNRREVESINDVIHMLEFR